MSEIIEWVFRLVIAIVSAIQSRLLDSNHMSHCVLKSGALKAESSLLRFLISCQILKLIIFSIWRIAIVVNVDMYLPYGQARKSDEIIVRKKRNHEDNIMYFKRSGRNQND